MSPKLKCRQDSNVAKTEISTELKYHPNEKSPKLKCHKNGKTTKTKILKELKKSPKPKPNQNLNVTKTEKSTKT